MPSIKPNRSTRRTCVCGGQFNPGSGHSSCFACRRKPGGMVGEDANPRALSMIDMYRAGATCPEISQLFSLSPQRVQQILSSHGVSRADGGQRRKADDRVERARVATDARYYAKWGHTRDEHRKLLALGRGKGDRGPVRAFAQQRKSAAFRGIAWHLTLAEWWRIWLDSGKWYKRGRGHGAYVMSRRGDAGAYELGNVFIQLADINNSDRPQKKSGLTIGVRRVKSGRYEAKVTSHGRYRHLGTFATAEEAGAAYRAAIGG